MKKVGLQLSTIRSTIFLCIALLLSTFLFSQTPIMQKTAAPQSVSASSWPANQVEFTTDDCSDAIGSRGYITYGEYPQSYVGDSLNATLNSALSSGALTKTGKVYEDMVLDGSVVAFEEYSYEGEKYVLKPASTIQNITTENVGQYYKYESSAVGADTYNMINGGDLIRKVDSWFKVEPIKWYEVTAIFDSAFSNARESIFMASSILSVSQYHNENVDFESIEFNDTYLAQYAHETFLKNAGIDDYFLSEIDGRNYKVQLPISIVENDLYQNDQDYQNYISFLMSDVNEEGQYLQVVSDYALSSGAVCACDFFGIADVIKIGGFQSNYYDGVGLLTALWLSVNSSTVPTNFLPFISFNIENGIPTTLAQYVDTHGGDDITRNAYDYHIYTAEGLRVLSEYSKSCQTFDENWKFYLENDLDMSSIQDFVPLGGETVPGFGDFINPFTGYFNGQGHTISNLNFDMSLDYASLFAVVQDCTIVNLNLEYGEIAREYPGDKAGFGGLVSCCLADDVLISNVNVSIESLVNPPADGSGGLIGSVSIDNNSTVSITDCDVYIGRITAPLICGGMIGMMYYGSSGTLAISRCMVNVGTVDISPFGEQYYGGVIGVVVEDRGNDRARNIVLNQIYVNMGSINAPEYSRIGGLICFVVEPVVLTYNEVAVRADINCTNTADTYFGYEITDSSVEPTSVIGTNSYFNFTGNVAADFTGVGRYAGVFDVAREQYYSGFSDNEWVVFPNTHPTIREFMAIGDFAPIASVEDKLIELGYTRVM